MLLTEAWTRIYDEMDFGGWWESMTTTRVEHRSSTHRRRRVISFGRERDSQRMVEQFENEPPLEQMDIHGRILSPDAKVRMERRGKQKNEDADLEAEIESLKMEASAASDQQRRFEEVSFYPSGLGFGSVF